MTDFRDYIDESLKLAKKRKGLEKLMQERRDSDLVSRFITSLEEDKTMPPMAGSHPGVAEKEVSERWRDLVTPRGTRAPSSSFDFEVPRGPSMEGLSSAPKNPSQLDSMISEYDRRANAFEEKEDLLQKIFNKQDERRSNAAKAWNKEKIDDWNKSLDEIKKKEASPAVKKELAERGISPKSEKMGWEYLDDKTIMMEPLNIYGDSAPPTSPASGPSLSRGLPKYMKHVPHYIPIPDGSIGVPDPKQLEKIQKFLSSTGTSLKKSLWDDRDWGGSLGAGLAALGDAFMAGGGMKSSFLNNIIKTREKRREEPFKQFQTFQKLLQTEINAQNLAEYRQGNMDFKHEQHLYNKLNDARGFKERAKVQAEVKAWRDKNYKQTEKRGALVDAQIAGLQTGMNNQTVYNMLKGVQKATPGVYQPQFQKWVQGNFNEALHYITGNHIKDMRIKPSKPSTKSTTSDKNAQQAFGGKVAKAVMENITGIPLEKTSAVTIGYAKTQANSQIARLQGLINKSSTKTYTNLKRVVNNSRDLIRTVGLIIGEPVVNFDQFSIDQQEGEIGGSIWFSPMRPDGTIDRGNRRKIDLPGALGTTLPSDVVASIRKLFGDYDSGSGFAGLLGQQYEKFYSPARHALYGGNLTTGEALLWNKETGAQKFLPGQEVAKFGYMLDFAKDADRSLNSFMKKIEANPGGKEALEGMKEVGYRIGSRLRDNIVQDNNKIADLTTRMIMDLRRKKGNNADIYDMPKWFSSLYEKLTERHIRGSQQPDVDPTLQIFYHPEKADGQGRFTRYKGRNGIPPVENGQPKWRWEWWPKYIRQYGLTLE